MAIEIASVVSKLQMLSTSDHSSVVSMNLFVALLCACIVLGHLLEENRWMNESITALLIVSLHFALASFLNEFGDKLITSPNILLYFKVCNIVFLLIVSIPFLGFCR
jgi:hypothetical protein